MKKTQLLLALLFLCTACLTDSGAMRKIEDYWQQLLRAKTAQEEAAIAEEINEVMQLKNTTFLARAVTVNGDTIILDKPVEKESIKSVLIRFSLEDGSFAGIDWKPKNFDNVYILFQE